MTYGNVHRYLLRSIATRGVMSLNDVNIILASFTEEEQSLPAQDIVKEINDEIKPFQQVIKIASDELTNEEVLVFLSLGYDDATRAQNIFSATELQYFRLVMEEIMTAEARQITGIHAINLVGGMKASFTKTDAQKRLDTWCRMRYLDKEENNYAMGVRAIYEFESYLRQNLPDTIEECCLCKANVFRGYNCPACGEAVHTKCLNKYLERVQKWPCCKVDFSADQLLEQIHKAESSRVQQTQRSAAETTVPEEEITAVEQTQDSTEDMQTTQDIIPEISQRITKKRKRQNE